MRWTLIPLAAAALASPPVHARGTGGGNEFFTHVNPAFDFRVESPDDWTCDGCDAPVQHRGGAGESQQSWAMAPLAQPDPTGIRVTFIDDFPAKTLADLEAALYAQDQNTKKWYPIGQDDRGGFVGFSSAPLGEDDSSATEYYLVAENRAIRIVWSKDSMGGHVESAQKLDHVKSSINRVSEPPRIRWIKTDRDGPVKIGDTACLLIGASDVRGKLDVPNLRAIDIEGTLPHWSFKKIAWEADPGQFRVCYAVSSTFGPNGLRVQHLSLEIPEDGRGIDCDAETAADPTLLTCTSLILYDGKNVQSTLKQTVAPVANPSADFSGPEVRAVTVDAARLTLTIDAVAKSGLASAEIFSADPDGKSCVIYGDELGAGSKASIASMVHEGWNTIDHLVIYDANGVPTLLRRPQASAKHRRTRGDGDSVTYEAVSWAGDVTKTTVPVQTFLKHGGGNP
jgi:hypothetical protein